VLLGITFSDTDDLKSWAEEVGIDCHLLCDVSRTVAMAYGAAESADQERPKRISVLVGPDGTVVKTYATPDAAAHPAEVLADLG
jgi:peroxiredoxin